MKFSLYVMMYGGNPISWNKAVIGRANVWHGGWVKLECNKTEREKKEGLSGFASCSLMVLLQ
jgi:hypothetical protein